MDEPDAYLSSTGQQDLLRIFEDFAYPQDPGRRPCQVVYVTHSPFLIDKNHGERLRVLEKGEADEGTRVVKNVARNHYEPLRSAFGSFVAETTFISNCNLMLEGASDQVLLAGMSARLRRQRVSTIDNLDLNTVTLVPAGSAKQIPYLVYLARGRDVDRPAVIVLLDGDKEADEAVKLLKKGPNGQPVIDAKFVLQLSELPTDAVVSTRPGPVAAIEDLIPVEIGVAAMKRYAEEFLEPHEATVIATVDGVDLNKAHSTHAALERAGKAKLSTFHLDKVGFARSVLDALRDEASFPEAAGRLDQNFRGLFRQLARLQREAMKDIATEKVGSKVRRLTRLFLRDHPSSATREQAAVLMEEIDASLDNSFDAEDLKSRTRHVRRTFTLDEEPMALIEDFDAFRSILDTLVYGAVIRVQDDAGGRAGL